MKVKFMFLSLLVLSGCSTSSQEAYKGSGTDALPESPCKTCTEKPFYQDGKWL